MINTFEDFQSKADHERAKEHAKHICWINFQSTEDPENASEGVNVGRCYLEWDKVIEAQKKQINELRQYARKPIMHSMLIEAGASHLVLKGYLLDGHRRHVFSQAEAFKELGLKLPWEDE